MKTIIAVTIFFLSLGLQGECQDKISLQFDAGANISFPTKKQIVFYPGGHRFYARNYSSSISYNLGVLLNYSINRHLFISYGLSLFQNRYDFIEYRYHMVYSYLPNGDLIVPTGEEGYSKQTYLNFSSILELRFFNKLPVNIGIGPYIGVLLGQKENLPPDEGFNQTYIPFDIGFNPRLNIELLKRTDFAFSLFAMSNLGLANLWPGEMENPSEAWKNNNLKLGIGLKF